MKWTDISLDSDWDDNNDETTIKVQRSNFFSLLVVEGLSYTVKWSKVTSTQDNVERRESEESE